MIIDQSRPTVHIGCAGWAVPRKYAAEFPAEGTLLSRYAGRFRAVEINSSFHRPHQSVTYAKWAASVPDDFRFAVKMPKAVTHDHRLVDVAQVLDRFLSDVTELGNKLGPLLVQLPPSLSFDSSTAKRFFILLRRQFEGDVVLEPRHASWFAAEASKLVTTFRVARVAADPALVPAAAVPGCWDKLVYHRLHGAARMYYSAYFPEFLRNLSKILLKAAHSASVWCIFDNTAAGAATVNALEVLAHFTTLD